MSDWILDLIERGRYLAVCFLMLAENVFPPIPSELVMPVAGIAAGRGDMHLAIVIAVGTAGAVAGQLLWFWLGTRVGEQGLMRLAERHGRWVTVSPDDIARVDKWFDAHGKKAVLIGRLIPGLRTLISLPAGLSGMPLPQYLAYSTLGSAVWTGLLAWAGFALGEKQEGVTGWIGPVSTGVIGGLFVLYLWRVVTFRGHAPRPRKTSR